MCKSFKKIISLSIAGSLTVALFFSFEAYAEKYRVLGFKNCVPEINHRKIVIGTEFSDLKKIDPNWSASGKGGKYIKIENISDGTVQIITCKENNTGSPKKEEGFLSFLFGSLTGQKKCSTRLPENDLFKGLSDNMSQTFYLLEEDNLKSPSTISFATGLRDESIIRFEYDYKGNRRQFEVKVKRGKIIISPSEFKDIDFSGGNVYLRLSADFIKSETEIIPLTDSMNIILIKA